MPERCVVVEARSGGKSSVRQLLIQNGNHVHRAYFVIADRVVKILHIRHGARKPFRRIYTMKMKIK